MVKDITLDNIDFLFDLIPPEFIDSLGREYYHGIYSCKKEDEPTGALIWRLENMSDPDKRRSEIIFFEASDTDTCEELILQYNSGVRGEGIKDTYFELSEVNDDMRSVLEAAGFTLTMQESSKVRMSLREIMRRKSGDRKVPDYIVPITEVPLSEFRKCIGECVKKKNTGTIEDVVFLPPVWYEPRLSCAAYKDGTVTGMYLVHKTTSALIEPQLLYATGPDSKMEIVHMLNYTVQNALEIYPSDCEIQFSRRDEKTATLVAYTLPDYKGRMVIAGTRNEI